MDFKKEEIIVIALASILFLAFIFLVKPSTTGFVTYSPLNYIYNSSAINLSDNEIKLIPIITTNTTSTTIQSILQVTAANDEEDRLSKINSLNNQDTTVNVNKNLNITLSSNLENNDVISIYLTHNKATNVKLCPINDCSAPYATASYSGTPDYVNFTISDMNSPTKTFNIIPVSENIKVDYIYAAHFTTTTNTTTTTIYPASASIETQDIIPANISKWDYIDYTQTLNNQVINYLYSTNSGFSWVNLTNKNISVSNSTKLKVKAILYSNAQSTPIINNLSLFYTEVIIQNITNATQTNASESNETSGNSNNSSQTPITFSKKVKLEEDKISLEVFSSTNLSNVEINLSVSNLTSSDKSKVKAIDITAPNINFDSATLKINYTNEEIQNINESTIKLYYYNETTTTWTQLDSIINTDENYVQINLTHFSTYGIFGDSLIKNPNLDSSSSSSSGGSNNQNTPSQTAVPEKRLAEIIPQKQEPKEIKLFEQNNNVKKEVKTDTKALEGITTEAVRNINPIKSFGIYLFVALVFILYLVYHKHVKKANSKTKKIQKKSLKRRN